MKAMLLEGPRQPLSLCEVDEPLLGDHDLLISVKACGVCRTDLHICDGELTPPAYPLILGHQIVGHVAALGRKATGFQVGQRVGVPWLGRACGACAFCLEGRENLCRQALFTGFSRAGGYAERCAADSRFCFALPDHFSDAQAAPLLCAGMIGYRALRLCGDYVRRLGLVGFGAAAHLVIQAALRRGLLVYAFTKEGDERRQRDARALGACWAGSLAAPPAEKLDAIIIFAPLGALVPQALRLLQRGGSLVCAGIHMSDIPSFPYSDLWQERLIRSVANLTRQDGVEFLQLAGDIPIRTAVTTYPLCAAQRALDDLRCGAFGGSAVLTIET